MSIYTVGVSIYTVGWIITILGIALLGEAGRQAKACLVAAAR